MIKQSIINHYLGEEIFIKLVEDAVDDYEQLSTIIIICI